MDCIVLDEAGIEVSLRVTIELTLAEADRLIRWWEFDRELKDTMPDCIDEVMIRRIVNKIRNVRYRQKLPTTLVRDMHEEHLEEGMQ